MSLQLCVRSGSFSPHGNHLAQQEQPAESLPVREEVSRSLAAWRAPFAHPGAVTQGKSLPGAAVQLMQAWRGGDGGVRCNIVLSKGCSAGRDGARIRGRRDPDKPG